MVGLRLLCCKRAVAAVVVFGGRCVNVVGPCMFARRRAGVLSIGSNSQVTRHFEGLVGYTEPLSVLFITPFAHDCFCVDLFSAMTLQTFAMFP